MERRVGRVLHEALGLAPARGAPRLAWCGTFHAIGARLLRAHAAALGLDPSFTVDDRSRLRGPDPRAAPAPRPGERRAAAFRRRRPAWRSTRGSSTRRPAWPRCCAAPSRGAPTRTTSSSGLFAAYAAEKQAQRVLDFDDLLVWWAAALGRAGGRARRWRRASTMCWSTSTRTPTACRRRSCSACSPTAAASPSSATTPSRSTRFAPPRCATSSTSPAASRRRPRCSRSSSNYRSTAPLLAASNAVIALAAERHAKELWSDRPAVEPPAIVWVAGESERGGLGRRPHPGAARDRARAEEPGGAVPRVPAQRRARARAGPAQHSLRQVRRPEVPRGGARQGRARGAALRRQSARRARRLARAAARPRHRRGDRRPADRARWPRPPIRRRRCCAFVPAAAVGAGLVGVRGAVRVAARAGCALAGASSPRSSAGIVPLLERLHDDAAPRAADVAHLVRLAAGYPRATASSPSSRSTRRRRRSDESGPGGARRGLPDPVDHPFGQGTGVERGLGAQRRRRLHPVGHGDRQRRRDRGGAAAALRGDDACPPPPAPARAAALLRHAAGGATATGTCTRRSAASCRDRCTDRFEHVGPGGGGRARRDAGRRRPSRRSTSPRGCAPRWR